MIPFQRTLIYLLLLGLLPVLIVIGYYVVQETQIDLLEAELAVTLETAKKKNDENLYNKLVKKKFADCDHFYIDNSIESISLLNSEQIELKKISDHGILAHDPKILQRIAQFAKTENRVSFVESPVKNYSSFQETVETLSKPIEVDAQDIQQILCKIEGVPLGNFQPPPNMPHLIITEFRLNKKPGPFREYYMLQMKMVKREYSK